MIYEDIIYIALYKKCLFKAVISLFNQIHSRHLKLFLIVIQTADDPTSIPSCFKTQE